MQDTRVQSLVWELRSHIRSDQIRSVAQSCPTLCDPMNRSMPGLPVHHQLPEFTQTQVHRVSDAIQPSHPLSSPSPPAPNPSQHQSLFFSLVINFTHSINSVYMSIPIHPTLSFPLGVHTFVLYICIFIFALQIDSSVPFF